MRVEDPWRVRRGRSLRVCGTDQTSPTTRQGQAGNAGALQRVGMDDARVLRGLQVDEVLDDEHAPVGAVLILRGMLAAAPHAAEVHPDEGYPALQQRVDQLVRELRMGREIRPRTVRLALAEAGMEGDEHIAFHPAQINVHDADVAIFHSGYIEHHRPPAGVIQREFLVHHVKMSTKMPGQLLLLIALRRHFRRDLHRQVNQHAIDSPPFRGIIAQAAREGNWELGIRNLVCGDGQTGSWPSRYGSPV